MTPRYDPKLLFQAVDTSILHDCFFCDQQIDPRIDFEHLVVAIPSKTLFTAHLDCFEQLAWSMLNFWVKYVKREEVTVVN